MTHIDARLAAMHNAIRECADLIAELRLDRNKAKLLAADQEQVIKRLRIELATSRELLKQREDA
jgi:F0F1-type ATP synthase gamma subunit